MNICAIDPGTRFAGYAIIKKDKRTIQLCNYGVFSLELKKGWPCRIGSFYTFFSEKLSAYNIDYIALETPFFYKNAATFMKLGYIRGIIYLFAYQHNLSLFSFSPKEIKQAICMNGNATKAEVACKVYTYFPTLERHLKDDITDAIALGITASRHCAQSTQPRK